jgi:sodium-dependent dicarboxylate transporter 2/3/5
VTGESPAGEPNEAARASIRPIPLALVAAAAVAAALLPIPGLSDKAHAALVVLIAVAGLWMTEAVPIAAASLLVPVLAVLLRAVDAKTAFAGFGDPILFLFLGTFLLTDALFQHGLQARLVRSVLGSRIVRDDPRRLLFAVALLGCVISAWVNNTATTAILLPLALAADGRVSPRLLTGILLVTAYAPSLGGLATPVGTAPNLLGLRLLEEATGERLSFAHWSAVFAPLALVATLLTAAYLAWRCGWGKGRVVTPRAASPPAPEPTPERAEPAQRVEPAERAGAPWSLAERTLLVVLLAVIAFWITPGILQATPLRDAAWVKEWSARFPEACVPLLGALLLFVLPSGAGRAPILDAGAFRRLDWKTLLLFGGGLSLGGILFETGLAMAIGNAIFAAMPIHGEYGIILAATLMAILVSEVTSNTASASLVVPIVIFLAQAAGIDPLRPAIAATVGCSFGFMLPVSTPPNALVFATGRVRVPEMVRYGIALDLAGAVLISGWVWWAL